jgi:hypothetical protein
MSYNLFIDDERLPPDDGKDWVVVRTSYDAILHVAKNGIPSYISFDHDLGGCDTSMEFIAWLIEAVLDERFKVPDDFNFYVHSQNPIGKSNIEAKMTSFLRHCFKQ